MKIFSHLLLLVGIVTTLTLAVPAVLLYMFCRTLSWALADRILQTRLKRLGDESRRRAAMGSRNSYGAWDGGAAWPH